MKKDIWKKLGFILLALTWWILSIGICTIVAAKDVSFSELLHRYKVLVKKGKCAEALVVARSFFNIAE
ncbi:hypothetical protein ACFL2Q_08545 [Thermodesulfobacteriota bacterium]